MFSAAESLLSKPGPATGIYPERQNGSCGGLESFLQNLQRQGAALAAKPLRRQGRIPAAIKRQAALLAPLDDAAVTAFGQDLRQQLRRKGLTTALVIRAFALIQEVSARTLGQRHFDTQLLCAWYVLQGRLAEMATGEGKTLAVALAAATAALTGIPVHVITVNEYLVRRDAAGMAPLYRALGVTVGFVTQDMPIEQRRAAYACDITYCTNKQVAFDYLRDRLILGQERSQLRLQLESAYRCSRQRELLLRGLCFAIVDEADSVLIDEARTPLILTPEDRNAIADRLFSQALDQADALLKGKDFFLDRDRHQVQLSAAGQEKILKSAARKQLSAVTTLRFQELVNLALRARHLLRRDQDYLVADDRVRLIDANTGRIMPDRSWEHGLQQLVELKENCSLSGQREHLGRLTYQSFFRRYLRLGGMSGTLAEVRSELWSVYQLQVEKVPLRRPSRRRQLPTRVFTTAAAKQPAIVAATQQLLQQGRAVLIGTASVAASEALSRTLNRHGIGHQLLNARQDQTEADIIARAGRPGAVTVATNMAGRGTDIKLAPSVAESGGLHVLATCRNESRRVDRQLYGRCARQGDPGSFQFLLAHDDELLERQGQMKRIERFCSSLTITRELPFRIAQRALEKRHRQARKDLQLQEQNQKRQLAFCGHPE